MIRADQISVQLGEKTIIESLSCEIPTGQVTVLLGRNGAGKSTLLKALSGEYTPKEGRVWLAGRTMLQYNVAELAHYRTVLAQHTHLSYDLSVEEVVEMGCYHQYNRLSARQRQGYIDRMLGRLDLLMFRNRTYTSLSGGEQKRVLLAKCLVQLAISQRNGHPQYLLLDEPTAALDIEQQYQFMELATELARESDIGVLAVLHDLNLAARYADQLILLRDGNITVAGTVDSVLTPEHIQHTFGVDCLVQPHPLLPIPLITTYGKYRSLAATAG